MTKFPRPVGRIRLRQPIIRGSATFVNQIGLFAARRTALDCDAHMRSPYVYPGIPPVMKTARVSLFRLGFAGLGLAILAAACTTPGSGNPGSGGSSSPGSGGAGGMTCPSGQDLCASKCIDTTSDSDN